MKGLVSTCVICMHTHVQSVWGSGSYYHLCLLRLQHDYFKDRSSGETNWEHLIKRSETDFLKAVFTYIYIGLDTVTFFTIKACLQLFWLILQVATILDCRAAKAFTMTSNHTRDYLELPFKFTEASEASPEKSHSLLLTNNLADRHGLGKCSRFTAATRVYSHHASKQQVAGCQILDAVAVSGGQLLVSNNPVWCCEANQGLC